MLRQIYDHLYVGKTVDKVVNYFYSFHLAVTVFH